MGLKEQSQKLQGHRLISTKYPPIALFDDVASAEDFEYLYAIQELTNPRIRDEVGDIDLIDPADIPFHCLRHRSYALAPFTHINPQGGRFNDGQFGALYLAENLATAIKEVKYHQEKYLANIEGLAFDRILLRELIITHQAEPIYAIPADDALALLPEDYRYSQQLARDLKKDRFQAVEYPSVRHQGNLCWALFTPKPVYDVLPSSLIEMLWTGKEIVEVSKVKQLASS